jgi:hypothetical protein
LSSSLAFDDAKISARCAQEVHRLKMEGIKVESLKVEGLKVEGLKVEGLKVYELIR